MPPKKRTHRESTDSGNFSLNRTQHDSDDEEIEENKKYIKRLTKAHVPELLKGLECSICFEQHKTYSALLNHSKVYYCNILYDLNFLSRIILRIILRIWNHTI